MLILEKRKSLKSISFYLKNLEKEEQNKSKARRKKEIIIKMDGVGEKWVWI